MATKVILFAKWLCIRATSDNTMERCDMDVGKVGLEEVLMLENGFGGTFWPAAFDWAIPSTEQCILMRLKVGLGLRVVDDAARPGASNYPSRSGGNRNISG
jgi:hypothetical protein